METEAECVACPGVPKWKPQTGSLDVTGLESGVLVLVLDVEVGVEGFVTEIYPAGMPELLGCIVRSNLATPWLRYKRMSTKIKTN